MFTKNQIVRVKVVVPTGVVVGFQIDDDGKVRYKIAVTDVDGVTNFRWFREEQLEEVSQ